MKSALARFANVIRAIKRFFFPDDDDTPPPSGGRTSWELESERQQMAFIA
jgi:hypothetical protein